MSIAKKEEVFCQGLVPRLDEPAVGVPIKKRPVSVSDGPVASGVPSWMRPSSTTPDMSIPAAGMGCGKESSFNIAKSDTNVTSKGKGITNSQIQDHTDKSFTLSIDNSKGMLFSGSSPTLPCAASDKRSSFPAESQRQNFLALQLASRRNGKGNFGSLVKEENVDHGLSGISSAEPHKSAHLASEINASSNSSATKIPSLDLNVPLGPADSLEGLSTIHERPIQPQKPQVSLLASASTNSSRAGQIVDNTLDLSCSYGIPHNSRLADVTLDLQLKPPARPELGINWKGLAPAPELSLSLFGNPVDEPKTLSASNALVDSEPTGSPEKASEKAAIMGSDSSPVEKTLTFVPSVTNPQNTVTNQQNAVTDPQNTVSSTSSGIDKMMSNSLVKKEPEEPAKHHVLNHAEETHLVEQQSAGLTNNYAESEKIVGGPQIPRKTDLGLNSDIFQKSNIPSGPDVATDHVPIPAKSLSDTLHAETMHAIAEVENFVKREEPIDPTPIPAVTRVADHSESLMAANSSHLDRNVAGPADELRESSSQPSISTLEAPCSNTDCKQPVSHIDACGDMIQKSCDVLHGSSNPIAEPLVLGSRNHATFDGTSQGTAEMDCSEDDVYSTNKPQGSPLGNYTSTEGSINATNVSRDLKKEHDNVTHQGQYCSSLKDKDNMGGVDGDRCPKIRVSFVGHTGEQEHRSNVFVSEKSEGKQSLKPDMNSQASSVDNSMHDAKTATGSSSTDGSLAKSTNRKMEFFREPPKTLDSAIEKIRRQEVKSDKSPHGKQAASSSEDHAKNAAVKMEHSEEIARQSDLQTRDSVLGEDSELDGASSSQPHSERGKANLALEKPECDKPKDDACKASSVQNETDGQIVGSHWRDLKHAYVNRNERWERFMQAEREKNKGEYQGGRHASQMFNHRRIDHRYGGRGHPRNFRGPRMSNDSNINFADEPINDRMCLYEDDIGHMHRIRQRRRSPPPDPRFPIHEPIDDLEDDMIKERFFMSHSHRQHTQGDHGFMHLERSRSPVQRRGAPVHFHRGRSPEVMHRSPPLMRTERAFVPHLRHNTRRRDSPDQLHPANLAELHAEDELVDRRKYRQRRVHRRSLEEADGDMYTYHAEDMEFPEGGGPRDVEGRFRNRLGHRVRGEQDGYRHRGPQAWRDGDSNDNRSKKRRY